MAIHVGVKIGLAVVAIGGSVWGIKYAIGRLLSLSEMEEEVLQDYVYFEIKDTEDSSTTPVQSVASSATPSPVTTDTESKTDDQSVKKVYVKAKSEDSKWTSKEYSWQCAIELDSDSAKEKITVEKLKGKLPTEASHKDDENRQNNKFGLVYVCSWFKDRSKSNDKKVVASFLWPENKDLEWLFRYSSKK